MTMRHHHLSDDRLIEVCLDAASPASERQHLAGCPLCQERRAHLTRLVTDVSGVAAAQADAVFTTERLARQRAHILQRIEHEARYGRVIAFPAGHAHPPSLRGRPGMRWIAGAAAAGVIIGLVAGQFAHVLPGTSMRPLPASTTAAAVPDTLQRVAAPLSEEEFLGRLELAVEGTGGSALRPLDDLTPRVWEVAAQ